MSAPSTATVMASVFDDNGVCIGFVLKRGLTGYEAFAEAEQSLGTFETAKQAANALLGEGGWA
jgi:hypothetical protein